MANFYVRVDGTAANKAAATGPETDATKCMNVTVLESETFFTNDVIRIYGTGGAISQITLDGGNLKGQVENPVIVDFPDSVTHTRSTAGHVLRLDGSSTAVEYVKVTNFIGENTVAATSDAVVCLTGDVGVIPNSVRLEDCSVLGNPQGDGFSQESGGSGNIVFLRCDPTNCGSGAPTAGHQGFTGHVNTQTAEMIDCTITNCAEGITYVNGSVATMTGGTITGSTNRVAKADTGSTVILNNVTVVADTATGRITDVNDASSTIEMNDCTVSITDHGADAFVRGTLTISGGNWFVDSGAATIQGLLAPSLIDVSGVNFDIDDCDRLFRADGNGGTIKFNRNVVDCSDMTGANVNLNVVYMDGTSTTEVIGNVWNDLGTTTPRVRAVSDVTITNITIQQNTVYNSTSKGEWFVDDTAGIDLNNNIFYNVADVRQGVGAGNVDNNCYFNSPNLGGTGSITSDPLFEDPANGNFHLQIASPAIGIGSKWWTTPVPTDSAGNELLDPPSLGAHETSDPVLVTNYSRLSDGLGDVVSTDLSANWSGPSIYTAFGLPDGLVINTSTGVVTGTTTKKGSFGVQIRGNNTTGSALSNNFIWFIGDEDTESLQSLWDSFLSFKGFPGTLQSTVQRQEAWLRFELGL
jgi:hypothetical protein